MDYFTISLIVTAVLLIAQYLWKAAYKGFDVFEKQGIPNLKPTAFFGTQLPILMRKVTITDFIINAFNAFPDSSITGLFDRKSPIYMIKDPELIKQMGVKDFENFIDHRTVIDGDSDPLFGNTLINLTGQKWKDMRATLSPIFTGSKMRQMFDLLSEVGIQVGDYFKSLPDEERVVEMKDVFARFALDVIASTSFGVKVDSLREKENKFYKQAQALVNFKDTTQLIRSMLFVFFPKLFKMLNLRVMAKSKTNFFEELISETEKARQEQKIVRPDLINLMMQLKKGQLKKDETNDDIGFATVQEEDLGKVNQKRKWTNEELMAQAFIFFFAGFETVATAGSFISYEIAVNPEVQDKLIEEIDEVNSQIKGKNLTYETLQKMKYLDMVISEGLRFWPPVDITDRVCVNDYKLKLDQGKEITIQKDANIWIPVAGLHMSEKYWENPKKFDPERFSDENKHKINQGAYLPFGVGPRNCIGSRFALMEVKAALFYILRDFRLVITEKTEVPLKMALGFGKISENGIWLKLEPRQK